MKRTVFKYKVIVEKLDGKRLEETYEAASQISAQQKMINSLDLKDKYKSIYAERIL